MCLLISVEHLAKYLAMRLAIEEEKDSSAGNNKFINSHLTDLAKTILCKVILRLVRRTYNDVMFHCYLVTQGHRNVHEACRTSIE
jgi:hypothetical protein